ncbi:hypothetical protein TcG_09816 [Trypanosoma cruzi]|nr:hypothetical protein TcG_09816 [Trypanosoma cruzi]
MAISTALAGKWFYHRAVLMPRKTNKDRDSTTWQRYNRRPSSAPKEEMVTLKRSGEFAVRKHLRRLSSLTWVGIAQQEAAPYAHTAHRRRTNNKEVRWRRPDTGDKGPRRSHSPIDSQDSGL